MHLNLGAATGRTLSAQFVGERFNAMKRIISFAFLFVLVTSLSFSAPGSFSASVRASEPDIKSSGSAYSAEWRLTGPTGGDARGLVVDPSDPDRFYLDRK